MHNMKILFLFPVSFLPIKKVLTLIGLQQNKTRKEMYLNIWKSKHVLERRWDMYVNLQPYDASFS